MSHQEELTGTIEKCIYQNEQNGFSVFVLLFARDKSTIVRGHLPHIQPGEQITVQGAWVMHPKFGKQFQAQQCTTSVPTSVIGLKKYLGSGMIKGIGPKYAEKLVDAFGEQTLEVIDKEPHKLSRVQGIGTKRAETITAAWQDQKEISNVMIFLQDKGISPAYATKIYKKYGQQSIAVVSQNPYRLAEEIWGVGFKTADQIALQLGFEKQSVKRTRAGILFALAQHSDQGHVYCELDELKTKVDTLLELEDERKKELLKAAFHDLYNDEKIKIVTHKEQHYIGISKHYYTEYGAAKKIEKLQEYPNDMPFDINEIYQRLRADTSDAVSLNDDQKRGIITCLQHKFSIVTGGPGTGKTTLIKKLIQILDESHVSYKLAAPTGRAAKRMSESTGKPALTIHRLLEFDVSSFGFAKNEQNALKCQYLIIDEASMLDIFLFYAILRAVPHHAHIVFIGDIDQLPSVGPGNVLHDLLASDKIAHVRLTHIFRQAQDSMIIVNAHRINQGEFPIAPFQGAKKDFIFIKETEPTNVPAHLEHIYRKGLAKYGLQSSDATTLVPMNRGVVGTQKLNHDIQQMLNPGEQDQQVNHRGTAYKVRDRVMQIRNNYDKNVFNGDIGTIEMIDTSERTVQVSFFGREVSYDYTELDELVLAYAISIHKSQGSEFGAVIIPIFMQHYMLLQRNLIYTAITRAKKLCIFIGQPKAIGMAIRNCKDVDRITFLSHFLKGEVTCR